LELPVASSSFFFFSFFSLFFFAARAAFDHSKRAMKIDSTEIIAFDGVKCKYGASECGSDQQ